MGAFITRVRARKGGRLIETNSAISFDFADQLLAPWPVLIDLCPPVMGRARPVRLRQTLLWSEIASLGVVAVCHS